MALEGVAMAYPLGAVERAMTVRDVILQALAGKLTWIQAAEILGRSAQHAPPAAEVRTVWRR
jgi:hypothetical protein